MFGQPAPPQQDNGLDIRFGLNLFYMLLSGFTTCFTVFLRRSFGGEAIGFNALFAIVIMVFYMGGHPESAGMIDFFGFWVIALVCQRIGYFIRRLRRVVVHSHYEGDSWIGVLLPFLERVGIARFLEVPLCVILGIALGQHDQALGEFVFFGAFGLMFKGMIDGAIERKHVQRMQDAAIEQRARLNRWRSGNF